VEIHVSSGTIMSLSEDKSPERRGTGVRKLARTIGRGSTGKK